MATKIEKLMIQAPDAYTLTEDYNTYINSLVKFLREDPSTTPKIVDPEEGNLYRFDLTSYLLKNSVPLEDHRLIMMINGITSSQLFDESVRQLLIPSQALIARLKQVYRTSLTVS